MASFPPNLEDGEKWLPSDIVKEISSSSSLPHFNSLGGGEKMKGELGRKQYEGTGYFHPKMSHVNIKDICKVGNTSTKGTGVYHQPLATATAAAVASAAAAAAATTKRQVRKNRKKNKKNRLDGANQLHEEVSQEIISLPQEWIY